MSFSTGDIFLILLLLFFWYATPVIYALLTVYGAIKKEKHSVLVKALAFANLLIAGNIIYYLLTLDTISYSYSHLQFVSISLAIFSPASFSLLINNQKKAALCIYLILFSLSFSMYNLYYFSQKMGQDRDAMIFSSLEQGNIKKLQQTFNDGCPDENIALNYLRTMANVEIYPASSFIFLLDCTDRNPQHRYSNDNFVVYYQDMLQKSNINSQLLNLLVSDYYHYLNDRDKQDLVSGLLGNIRYSNDSKEKAQIADNLTLFIKNHPELKDFIKVDDKTILYMIDNGDGFSINYLKPYYFTQDKSLLLAISVLSQNDQEIMRKISQDQRILNIKILNSVGGIWGSRDVDLLSYIFRYGSANLITWLLSHSLDNTAKFDYQRTLFNHASQQDEDYCENYLLNYIDFNRELTDEKKQSISQQLKQRSHCQEKIKLRTRG